MGLWARGVTRGCHSRSFAGGRIGRNRCGPECQNQSADEEVAVAEAGVHVIVPDQSQFVRIVRECNISPYRTSPPIGLARAQSPLQAKIALEARMPVQFSRTTQAEAGHGR